MTLRRCSRLEKTAAFGRWTKSSHREIEDFRPIFSYDLGYIGCRMTSTRPSAGHTSGHQAQARLRRRLSRRAASSGTPRRAACASAATGLRKLERAATSPHRPNRREVRESRVRRVVGLPMIQPIEMRVALPVRLRDGTITTTAEVWRMLHTARRCCMTWLTRAIREKPRCCSTTART